MNNTLNRVETKHRTRTCVHCVLHIRNSKFGLEFQTHIEDLLFNGIYTNL